MGPISFPSEIKKYFSEHPLDADDEKGLTQLFNDNVLVKDTLKTWAQEHHTNPMHPRIYKTLVIADVVSEPWEDLAQNVNSRYLCGCDDGSLALIERVLSQNNHCIDEKIPQKYAQTALELFETGVIDDKQLIKLFSVTFSGDKLPLQINEILESLVFPLGKLEYDVLVKLLSIRDKNGCTLMHKKSIFRLSLPLLEKLESNDLIKFLSFVDFKGKTPLHNPEIFKIAIKLLTTLDSSTCDLASLNYLSTIKNFNNAEVDQESENLASFTQQLKTDKNYAKFVILNIKLFNFFSQHTLFEVAKSSISVQLLPHHIQNFEIQDENKRFELAELCTPTMSRDIIDYLDNFNITNQKFLIFLAKKCAENKPGFFSRFIKYFNIKSEMERFQIAQICLNSPNVDAYTMNGLVKNLLNFDLRHSSFLEVIKGFAKKGKVEAVASQLNDLGIKDPAELKELALLFAERDGLQTIKSIENFRIIDPDFLKVVVLKCALEAGIKISFSLKKIGIHSPFAQRCRGGLIHGNIDGAVEELKLWIEKLQIKDQVSRVLDEIIAMTDSPIKNDKLGLLSDLLFLYDCFSSKEVQDWIRQEHLISLVVNFPRPFLRVGLCRAILSFLQMENYFLNYQALNSNKTERDWAKLMRMLLAGLCCTGLNPKIAQDFIAATDSRRDTYFNSGEKQKVLVEMLLWLVKDNNLTIKEKGELLIRLLEETNLAFKTVATGKNKETDNIAHEAELKLKFALTLKEIHEQKETFDIKMASIGIALTEFESALTSVKLKSVLSVFSEKLSVMKTTEALNEELKNFIGVFASIKNKKRWVKSVNAAKKTHTATEYEQQLFKNVSALLSLFQVDSLIIRENIGSLEQTLNALLFKKYNLTGIKDLSSKFAHYFGPFIEPLMTYHAQLSTLEDPKVLRSLGEFVQAVLKDTFENDRNEIRTNAHLKTIHDAHPNLLEKWQKSLPSKIFELTNEMGVVTRYTLSETVNPIKILLIGKCTNSCQWVANAPMNSRGLLGYLMDGKNRFLIIENEEGEVKGRCLIRLLWDGEKAVLYRESYYSDSLSEEQLVVLDEMAIAKAKELGIPLVGPSSEGILKGKPPFDKPLFALGSSVPYEYCDATAKVEEWGEFTISKSCLLYTPEIL